VISFENYCSYTCRHKHAHTSSIECSRWTTKHDERQRDERNNRHINIASTTVQFSQSVSVAVGST